VLEDNRQGVVEQMDQDDERPQPVHADRRSADLGYVTSTSHDLRFLLLNLHHLMSLA
jgi:hypothetical protein